MQPRLGFVERPSINGDIQSVWDELEYGLSHVDVGRDIEDLDSELLLGVRESRRDDVDSDNSLSTLDLGPSGSAD